jgi:8-oxo-dGTP pyrophosphatase MutT (NUDIX family)
VKFVTETWADSASKAAFIAEDPPVDLPISAAVIMIIRGDQLLLTKIHRGWDIPGGHLEAGETSEQAVIREVYEETGGTLGAFKRVGYLLITKIGSHKRNTQYSDKGGIMVFWGNEVVLDDQHDFTQHEATETRFVPFKELAAYHHNWTKMKQQMLEYVLALDSQS